MPQRSSRIPWVLAGLVGLSLWPYYRLLGQWPMTMDAAVWIGEGLPGAPGLLDWAFRTRQFGVGWRPLTALSYTLGTLLGGTSMHAQRAIDLLAHLLCALLVYSLARALAVERPRWAAAVPALVFALHPAVDAVVPYLARRSYSLATACVLAALVVAVRSLGDGRPAGTPALRSPLSAGLLLAGLLFHELAVVGALLVPLLGLAAVRGRRDRLRRVAAASALPAALLALGWLARSRVVAGVGGYEAVEAVAFPGPASVLAGFLRALLAPGSAGTSLSPAAIAVAAVAAPFYLWASLAAARRRSWAPLALLAWLAGYGALFAALGVWFPRQAYVAVVPLALLFGEVAAATLAGSRGTGRTLRLIPQAAFAALLLAGSPALRGADPERARVWAQRNALLEAAARGLAAVPAPATVRVVLPFRSDAGAEEERPRYRPRRGAVPREARQPLRWMERLAAGRDVRIEELAYFESAPLTTSWPVVETVAGRPVVRLPEGRAVVPSGRRRGSGEGSTIAADEPPSPGRAAYLFLAAPGGGRLLPLGAGR